MLDFLTRCRLPITNPPKLPIIPFLAPGPPLFRAYATSQELPAPPTFLVMRRWELRLCPIRYDTARDELSFRPIARVFLCLNTVFTMKPTLTFVILGILIFVGTASAQEQFEWQKGNYESVRLDPANYHTGKNYEAVGGTIHVDIEAEQPVTISLWTGAPANGAAPSRIPSSSPASTKYVLREHVVKTTLHLRSPAGAYDFDRS